MRRSPGSALIRRGGGVLAAAVLTLALGALAPESDAKSDPRIYALKNGKAKILGTRASDWTLQWWQWVSSLPVSVNPLFEETGELVEVGQREPVWFLGGVFNESGVTVRTATIPAGKALLIPLMNGGADNVGVDPPRSLDELRAFAEEGLALVDPESLFLTIDGEEVPDLAGGSVIAGPLTWWMPEGNLFQYFGYVAPRGVYSPGIMWGYWVMVRPLPLGEHTIHFGASSGGFTLDITYNLTVVESNQP